MKRETLKEHGLTDEQIDFYNARRIQTKLGSQTSLQYE